MFPIDLGLLLSTGKRDTVSDSSRGIRDLLCCRAYIDGAGAFFLYHVAPYGFGSITIWLLPIPSELDGAVCPKNHPRDTLQAEDNASTGIEGLGAHRTASQLE